MAPGRCHQQHKPATYWAEGMVRHSTGKNIRHLIFSWQLVVVGGGGNKRIILKQI
jgi:hypothetical protein